MTAIVYFGLNCADSLASLAVGLFHGLCEDGRGLSLSIWPLGLLLSEWLSNIRTHIVSPLSHRYLQIFHGRTLGRQNRTVLRLFGICVGLVGLLRVEGLDFMARCRWLAVFRTL